MKRVVSSSIAVVFLFAVIAIAIFIYKRYSGLQGGDPLKAIPDDAAFFIEADLNTDSISKIVSMPLWRNADYNSSFNAIAMKLEKLDSCFKEETKWRELFAKEHLFISAHVVKSGQCDLLFLASMPVRGKEDLITALIECMNDDKEIKMNERSYEGIPVYEAGIDTKTNFTFAVSRNVFLGSFTSFLVEDAIRQQKISENLLPDFKKLTTAFSGSENKNGSRLKISFRKLPEFISVFTGNNLKAKATTLQNFAQDMNVTLSVVPGGLKAEGSVSTDDSTDMAFFLKSQIPAKFNAVNIFPGRTAMFSLFYASSMPAYFNFIEKIENEETDKKARNKFESIVSGEFGLLLTEPSSVFYDNNAYFVCKTINGVKTKNILNKWCEAIDGKLNVATLQEKYNGYQVGYLRIENIIPRLFGHRYKIISKNYFTVVGNFVVFANQPSSIRSFIDDVIAKRLFMNNESFTNIKPAIAQNGNYLFYARQQPLHYVLKANLSASWFDAYRKNAPALNGWQSLTVNCKRMLNTIEATAWLSFEDKKNKNGVTLAWSQNFDSTLAGGPWLLNDKAANNKFILVQDKNNTLRKFDNSGNEVWEKKLSSTILGNVYEVDIYRNNFSQFVFNTSSQLVVIDSDGDFISNFPLRLPSPATAALTLTIQEEGTNRVYISCANNRVYAYEANGKTVSEWDFNYSNSTITQPLQHFVIGSKSFYSCYDNSGAVYFLNQNGGQVINPTSSIFPAIEPAFYLEKEKDGISFITLNNDMTLKRVLINGEVETVSNELADQSVSFTAHDLDGDQALEYLFLKKDKLIAARKNYTPFFETNLTGFEINAISISEPVSNYKLIMLTSAAQNKVWLYSSTGNMLDGFPVKGYKNPAIADINNDGKLFLISTDDTGGLYVYAF